MASPEWRAVDGWPYEVSCDGAVRSVSRTWAKGHGANGSVAPSTFRSRLLKPTAGKNKYLTVKLAKQGAAPRTHYVHRLVAHAFLGPCPDGLEVCHADGDRQNNEVTNLRYDTRSANALDSVRHGTCFVAGPNRPNRWLRRVC